MVLTGLIFSTFLSTQNIFAKISLPTFTHIATTM